MKFDPERSKIPRAYRNAHINKVFLSVSIYNIIIVDCLQHLTAKIIGARWSRAVIARHAGFSNATMAFNKDFIYDV